MIKRDNKNKTLKFIDLFAGIGGIRLGFEQACKDFNINTECVFTSEIKEHAKQILKQNYKNEIISGDITKISSNEIPNFDILLAGFPCQPFSSAGKRLGFDDVRGTLFFEVARILKDKKPVAFLLENVDALVTHNKNIKNDKIGNTFSAMLKILESLGYNVTYKILNSCDFGVPQDRKRVYIVGSLTKQVELEHFRKISQNISFILEKNIQTKNSTFIELLLKYFSVNELAGKSIKDKRGGANNIHSWDIALRGEISKEEKELLNNILLERRKKKWAAEIGIDWMDGMPLTFEQISTFYRNPNLKIMLENLSKKGYLKKEYPKKKVGNKRVYDNSLPMGYNIVVGKLSFEISKILDPNDIAPALVATDMNKLFVIDGKNLRPLTLREGLRLFGFPDDFLFDINYKEGIDLLGNTVAVPVIKAISERILKVVI